MSGSTYTGSTLLIINGNSRKGAEQFSSAKIALEAQGFVLDAHLVKSAAETQTLIRKHIEVGAEMVICGGGDGTLSSCAGMLAGSQTAMGILPLGTGNTFARGLNMPLELAAAARVLSERRFARVDLGQVNGRIFINSVALGASAQIAAGLDKELKRRLGLLAWPVSAFRTLKGQRPLSLELKTDDLRMKVKTHQIICANNSHVAGFITAPMVYLDDGKLETVLLGRDSWWSLITGFWSLIVKKSNKLDVFSLHGTHIRVVSLKKQLIANVDGELCEHTPLEVKILPLALRVAVPQNTGLRSATNLADHS